MMAWNTIRRLCYFDEPWLRLLQIKMCITSCLLKVAADLRLAFMLTPAIEVYKVIQKGFVSKCVELMRSLEWLCRIKKPRNCSGKWTTWHAAMLLSILWLYLVSDKGQHHLACYPHC